MHIFPYVISKCREFIHKKRLPSKSGTKEETNNNKNTNKEKSESGSNDFIIITKES